MAETKVTTNEMDNTAGAIAGAWKDFTPSFPLTSGGAAVWGNATFAGAYQQIGKTVHYRAKVTLGTTTNFTGLTAVHFTPPVPAANGMANCIIGQAFFMTGYQLGRVYLNSSTDATVWTELVSGSFTGANDITPTVPHTWAATHYIAISGTYEAA